MVRVRKWIAVGRRERGAKEDGRLGSVDSDRRRVRLRVMVSRSLLRLRATGRWWMVRKEQEDKAE